MEPTKLEQNKDARQDNILKQILPAPPIGVDAVEITIGGKVTGGRVKSGRFPIKSENLKGLGKLQIYCDSHKNTIYLGWKPKNYVHFQFNIHDVIRKKFKWSNPVGKNTNQFSKAEWNYLKSNYPESFLGHERSVSNLMLESVVETVQFAREEIVTEVRRQCGPLAKVVFTPMFVVRFEVFIDFHSSLRSDSEKIQKQVELYLAEMTGNRYEMDNDGGDRVRRYKTKARTDRDVMRSEQGRIKIYIKENSPRLEFVFLNIRPGFDAIQELKLELYSAILCAEFRLLTCYATLPQIKTTIIPESTFFEIFKQFNLRGFATDRRYEEMRKQLMETNVYNPFLVEKGLRVGDSILDKLSDPETGILVKVLRPKQSGGRSKRHYILNEKNVCRATLTDLVHCDVRLLVP